MPDVERLHTELQRLAELRDDVDHRIERIQTKLAEAEPLAAGGRPEPPGLVDFTLRHNARRGRGRGLT